jgi:SAM-dependent methyltransferase
MRDVDEIREYWERHARRDPLWAVLSEDSKRDGRWDVDRFFQTGVSEVAAVFYQLDSRRLDLTRGAALDFGCGVGRLSQALASRFDRVVGVDISTRMVALASDFNAYPSRVSYVVNPNPNLRLFGDRTFDFVISNIVLQHLSPELAFDYIGEFFRVLTPGGVLVFQLPSHQRTGSDAPAVAGPSAMPDEAYHASLEAVGLETLSLRPGGTITITIAVTNTSPFAWNAQRSGIMRAGNHWLSGAGDRMLTRDDGRSALPRILESSEACHVPLTITAPAEAGDYRCAFDIAHEGVLWFHDKGSPRLTIPVRVGDIDRDDTGANRRDASKTREPDRVFDRAAAAGQDLVNLASPDPGDFPMHGVGRADVIALLTRHGGTLLHVEDDIGAGTAWISYRYYVRAR